jgi:uncharacterized protein Yka (UPF0111/DUF47 family)
MKIIRKLIRTAPVLGPGLLALFLLEPGPLALAQEAQNNETDQQFHSRIQSSLKRSKQRTQDIERNMHQRMRMPGGRTDRVDIGGSDRIADASSGSFGQSTRDPMSSDLSRFRAELRTLRSRIDKGSERMTEQYRSRDDGTFDRGHWESYARRIEQELDDMERELRRP